MTSEVDQVPSSLSDLLNRIEVDDWRIKTGFSPDMAELNQQLWNQNDAEVSRELLLDWLAKFQPCLFGRVAARSGAISTCVITEEQLRNQSDQMISDYIQSAREEWTRQGFNGGSSGFVIFLLSATLATAKPNDALFNFSKRLCELHLLRDDIEADKIYHEEIFLQANDRAQTTWKWLAGINFFGACGDQRWWHDHRIPGGIALSVNSVGHLVKSRILAEADLNYSNAIGEPTETESLGKIDSLDTALEWAMRTIHNASNAASGKATYLVPRPAGSETSAHNLPAFLQGYDDSRYEGYYHTDFTLPALYFKPEVQRPEIEPISLDFTYLTQGGVANLDHVPMGTGRRIREERETGQESRNARAHPVEIAIAGCPRLTKALGWASES